MDQNDDTTAPEPELSDDADRWPSSPPPASDEAAAPAAGDEPAPASVDAPEPAPTEGPTVELAVPVEEPVDGAPTPVAAPTEGPVAGAAHDVSARPKPVMAKITPVLAAVAVAWVLKKLLARNRD